MNCFLCCYSTRTLQPSFIQNDLKISFSLSNATLLFLSLSEFRKKLMVFISWFQEFFNNNFPLLDTMTAALRLFACVVSVRAHFLNGFCSFPPVTRQFAVARLQVIIESACPAICRYF